MTNQLFVPPASEGLPLAALDSATEGADRLDARAREASGRNFLAHALVQLARDGWLRTEPGAGFEPVRDRETPEPLPAASVVVSPPPDRAALVRVRQYLEARLDQVAVDPAEVLNVLTGTTEPPLSPYYSHEACGFHWHGRDGMDIPMRDGQPVCPRCELHAVEKRLRYTQRRREEVGAESLRRGKIKAEQAERIHVLEREIDGVREQLGKEMLRADAAEAELRRLAAEAPQPETGRTTADKAYALGMTDTEYRAHSHRVAVEQVRAAAKGLYADVGFRVEDALNGDGAEAPQPDTETGDDEEHVCKPGTGLYWCPTVGEVESDCHGGFDVCCSRPDLHQPISASQPAAADPQTQEG